MQEKTFEKVNDFVNRKMKCLPRTARSLRAYPVGNDSMTMLHLLGRLGDDLAFSSPCGACESWNPGSGGRPGSADGGDCMCRMEDPVQSVSL